MFDAGPNIMNHEIYKSGLNRNDGRSKSATDLLSIFYVFSLMPRYVFRIFLADLLNCVSLATL